MSNKIKYRTIRRICLSLLIVFGTFIWLASRPLIAPDRAEQQAEPDQALFRLSAWLADWQWQSGVVDLGYLAERISSLQVFALYFDYEDKLYFTPELQEAMPRISEVYGQNELDELYITIVNDIFNKDGTTVQKDAELVARLTSSHASREHHINEIIDIVLMYDFAGVEIDYENISKASWPSVLAFYDELYHRLTAAGKQLRIVLEPRAPLEELQWPEGPGYVLMAYNLFGYHSGPGPKADFSFISELAERFKHVPGEKYLAFSAGGFDWRQDGRITAITEQQAAELIRKSELTPVRDQASASVTFDYFDEEKKRHTVWYADGTTIMEWFKASKEEGYYHVALWRLGGLQPVSMEEWNSLWQ